MVYEKPRTCFKRKVIRTASTSANVVAFVPGGGGCLLGRGTIAKSSNINGTRSSRSPIGAQTPKPSARMRGLWSRWTTGRRCTRQVFPVLSFSRPLNTRTRRACQTLNVDLAKIVTHLGKRKRKNRKWKNRKRKNGK